MATILKDQLAAAEQKLARLETNQHAELRVWDRRFEIARQKDVSSLTDLQERFRIWKQADDQDIALARQEIDLLKVEVEAQISAARSSAQVELQVLKSQSQDIWLDQGGTREAFEQAWPDIEKDLLKKQILETVTPVLAFRQVPGL